MTVFPVPNYPQQAPRASWGIWGRYGGEISFEWLLNGCYVLQRNLRKHPNYLK